MTQRKLGPAILPPARLGVLGGGQLGRMFAVAAQTMGYEVVVLDPSADAPAGRVATQHLIAPYDDPEALAHLAATCAAVTTEFENVPAASLDWLAQRVTVAPSAAAVAVAQDRIAEKTHLQRHGFAVAPFAVIVRANDLDDPALEALLPGILKQARFGYDGKGQANVASLAQARVAFAEFGAQPCVLEKRLKLEREVSVIVVRYSDGSTQTFAAAENWHTSGILDISIVPARIGRDLAETAASEAARLAQTLNYVGVLAVEFFIVDGVSQVLVNEMAPRPHNSGHYTLDACRSSQFEAQVRTLCNLPPADLTLREPAVMVNILGDAWFDQTVQREPPWQKVLDLPGLKLHLYGKSQARPGRKMGHFTCIGAQLEAALAAALQGRACLRSDALHHEEVN